MADYSYRTRDGDVLDDICFQHYGTTSGRIVERVLEANPGLAEQGPVYPAGVVFDLPELSRPTIDEEAIRLWD